MHVRIVSLAGPLINSVGSLRVSALAKYLVACGDDVTLVTSPWPPRDPVVLHSDYFAGTEPNPITATSQYSGVSMPTERGSLWRATAPRNLAANPRLKAARTQLSRAYDEVASWPDRPELIRWRRKAATLAAGRELPRADVVVSSAPEFSLHVAGATVARAVGVPWVPDYRDLWSNSTYYQKSEVRRRIDRAWEKRLLTSATAVTAATDEFVASLRDLAPDLPGYVVMNGFDADELSQVPLMDLGPGRHIVYAGTIYPGKRDPMPLLRALADADGLDDVVVHLVGPEPGSIDPEAWKLGLGDRLRVVGRVSKSQAQAYMKAADVALLLTWNNPGEAGVVSAKLFEYIGLGKPVLATGFEHGRMAQLLRQYGHGLVANEPSQIDSAMRLLMARAEQGDAPTLAQMQPFERPAQLQRWRSVLADSAHAR